MKIDKPHRKRLGRNRSEVVPRRHLARGALATVALFRAAIEDGSVLAAVAYLRHRPKRLGSRKGGWESK